MTIKLIIYIAIFQLLLSGCELFVISALQYDKPAAIDISQRTPLGVVYLFKTELDSNNIYGALSVLANPHDNKYLAIERYEMKNDVSRIKRIIANRKITEITTDTLSENSYKFSLEFDWSQKLKFTASKISDTWYITNYGF